MVKLPAMTNGSWDWRVRKTIQIQLITVNLLWQFVACEQSTSSFWVSTVYKNAHFLCHKFSWTIYSSASQIWSEGQRAEKIAFCAADSHCNITTKHCIDGQKKTQCHRIGMLESWCVGSVEITLKTQTRVGCEEIYWNQRRKKNFVSSRNNTICS